MAYKPKQCARCPTTFHPTSGNELYCSSCRKIVQQEAQDQFHQRNPDANAEYQVTKRDKARGRPVEMKDCPDCGGKGKTRKITGREPGLFGKVKYEDRNCTRCNGAGKVRTW